MTTSVIFGRFAVDCWEDPAREDVEAVTEYFDDIQRAQNEAKRLFVAGRFKWIEVSRWIGPGEDDWEILDTYS